MEKIKNNVMFKIFLMFILGVLLFTMIPSNIYATNNQDLYIDGHKILSIYYGDGENPMTRGYFDPGPFTFSNAVNGVTRYYDGGWMALEAKATSTAGVIPIHIDLYIYNTHIHHDCTIWADGINYKFDWKSLGSTGGSSADCYYFVDSQYSSATNTVDVKSYSWY